MKSCLVVLCSVLLLSFSGWMTDFDKAKAEAKSTHRCILLNFSGSDWCVPCIQLKREVFENIAFKSFADSNLILVNADFPRNKKNKLGEQQLMHNESLAEKYNPGGKFPFTLLLDGDGKILKQWEGLPANTAEDFIVQIKKLCDDNR